MGLIIALILIGLLLIVAEILIIPGVFVAGSMGVISVVGACYLAFVEYGQVVGAITVVVCIVLLSICVIFALRSKTWRKITLETNIDSHVDIKPDDKGFYVGQKGKTITRLNPMGKAKIGDYTVEVMSEDGLVDANAEIEISSMEEYKVNVKRVNL